MEICLYFHAVFVFLLKAVLCYEGGMQFSQTQKSFWEPFLERPRGGAASPYMLARLVGQAFLTISIFKLSGIPAGSRVLFFKVFAIFNIATIIEPVEINNAAPVKFNKFNINAIRILN